MDNDLTFIQAVVKDYDSMGVAKAQDEVTLESLDGGTIVVLEPIFDDAEKEAGVRIFSNGTALGDFLYADKGFVESFSDTMDSELNI